MTQQVIRLTKNNVEFRWVRGQPYVTAYDRTGQVAPQKLAKHTDNYNEFFKRLLKRGTKIRPFLTHVTKCNIFVWGGNSVSRADTKKNQNQVLHPDAPYTFKIVRAIVNATSV